MNNLFRFRSKDSCKIFCFNCFLWGQIPCLVNLYMLFRGHNGWQHQMVFFIQKQQNIADSSNFVSETTPTLNNYQYWPISPRSDKFFIPFPRILIISWALYRVIRSKLGFLKSPLHFYGSTQVKNQTESFNGTKTIFEIMF